MSAAGTMAQPSNFKNQNGASFLGSMISSARNEFIKNMAKSSNPSVNVNATMAIPLPDEYNKSSSGSFMDKIGKRIWSSGTADVSTATTNIPQSKQDEPDYQIHFFSAATAEKTEEDTVAQQGKTKGTTGGSGGGGGDNDNQGGNQRPQRKIDENHTRDSIIVEIKDDLKLKDIISKNKVVLFHDSSVKEFSIFEQLKDGGVDFSHVDVANLKGTGELENL